MEDQQILDVGYHDDSTSIGVKRKIAPELDSTGANSKILNASADLSDTSADFRTDDEMLKESFILMVKNFGISGSISAIVTLLQQNPSLLRKPLFSSSDLSDSKNMKSSEVSRLNREDQDFAFNNGLAIHYLSAAGNIEVMRALIKAGSAVNCTDENLVLPLHVTASKGCIEATKLLLEEGKTPLHVAAKYGHVETIRILMEAGADKNVKNNEGRTALHSAVTRGHTEAVKILLQAGADGDTISQDGRSPLHSAAIRGHVEIARALLLAGVGTEAKDSLCGDTVLHDACRSEHEDTVKLLAEHMSREAVRTGNEEGRTPLHLAAKRGLLGAVLGLLFAGAETEARDNSGGSALHDACFGGGRGNVPTEAAAVVVDEDKKTPSAEPVSRNYTEVVRALLQAGANIEAQNDDEQTPVQLAAAVGRLGAVSALLEGGASANTKSKDGASPLHYAAQHGSQEIVRLLLEAGARAEATDADGDTAFHIACAGKHAEAAKLILERMPPTAVASCNTDSRTLLHAAASIGQVELARRLLAEGVGLDIIDKHGDTALHDACQTEDSETAKLFIARMSPETIAIANKNGRTALHLAARNANAELVKSLLAAGSNAMARDKVDCTPLHDVCSGEKSALPAWGSRKAKQKSQPEREGAVEIVRVLLEAGADKDAKNNVGTTPLHKAAYKGYLGVCKALLEASADVDCKQNENGCTPLHLAAYHGHEEIAQALLDAGANTETQDSDGDTAFHVACAGQHMEVAKLIFQRMPPSAVTSSNKDGRTPLHFATVEGYLEITRSLLTSGANSDVVDKSGDTALHNACLTENAETAKLLIAHMSREAITIANKKGRTALHFAALTSNLVAVKSLLAAGSDARAQDSDGNTALHEACRGMPRYGDFPGFMRCKRKRTYGTSEDTLAVVRALLETGADARTRNQEGTTPLLTAANNGYVGICKTLLEAGADVDSKREEDGRSPLHFAAYNGHEEIVRLLLDAGANTEAQDAEGDTAFHEACREGFIAIAQLIVERISHRAAASCNQRGETSLHLAAGSGSMEIAQILLDAGADADAQDSDGETALHGACRSRFLDVAKLLVEHMSREAALGLNKKGKSVLQVWGVDKDEEDDDDEGEDDVDMSGDDEDKQAFAAYMDVMFADVL